jgi:hypothetical protein
MFQHLLLPYLDVSTIGYTTLPLYVVNTGVAVGCMYEIVLLLFCQTHF